MGVFFLLFIPIVLNIVLGEDEPWKGYTSPPNRIYKAFVGESVILSISSYSFSLQQWTIINRIGNTLSLPKNATVQGYSRYQYPSVQFVLPSAMYYGTYLCKCTYQDDKSNKTIIFQILEPGDRPDTPAYFQVIYVTHYSLQLKWNCMPSNHDAKTQRIHTVLKEVNSNAIVSVQYIEVSGSCFNSTHFVNFWHNLNPDTEYEATVNSTNDLGTSDTVALRVKTSKAVQLYISPDTIEVTYPEASISYRIESENNSLGYILEISCTVEHTGQSTTIRYNANNSGIISMNIREVANTTEYVFDFVLRSRSVYPHCGQSRFYDLDYYCLPLRAIKNVRVRAKRDGVDYANSPVPNSTLSTSIQLQTSIQVKYPEVSISFRIDNDTGIRRVLEVSCTAECSGQSTTACDSIRNNITVSMNISNLVNITEYVFDVTLRSYPRYHGWFERRYCYHESDYFGKRRSSKYSAPLQAIKGIRFKTQAYGGDCSGLGLTSSETTSHSPMPVVLSVVVVSSVIIVLLVAFLIWKRRHRNSVQTTNEVNPGTNNTGADETYETVTRGVDENIYTELHVCNDRQRKRHQHIKKIQHPVNCRKDGLNL